MKWLDNWIAKNYKFLNRIFSIGLGLASIIIGVFIALVGVGGLFIISTIPFVLGIYLIWNGGIKGESVLSENLLFAIILPGGVGFLIFICFVIFIFVIQ